MFEVSFQGDNTTLPGCILAIAVGAVLLVPNFQHARAEGQLTACGSNLKNIGTASEMYFVDHDVYPSQLTSLTPEYLKQLPLCPASGEGYSWIQNTLTCPAEQHQGLTYTYQDGLTKITLVPSFAKIWAGRIWRLLLFLTSLCMFYAFLGQRPTPNPDAQRAMDRSPGLEFASWLSWILLNCSVAIGIGWLGSLTLAWYDAVLAGLFFGGMLTEWVVRMGWRVWATLSPKPLPEMQQNKSPQEEPTLDGGLRAEVSVSSAKSRAASLHTLGVPATCTLILTTLGASLSVQLAGLGFALGALLSFPLYLWARRWKSDVLDCELEFVPGAGLILMHSHPWGQPRTEQLGTLADVESVTLVPGGYSLVLKGREFRLSSDEFVDALGGPSE